MPNVSSRSVVVAFALGLVCVATPARAAPSSMDARFQSAIATEHPKAAAVYDPSENRLLWGSHEDKPLPPASTIKMLTALVVAEHLRPADTVQISRAAAHAPADQIAWREGATFSADQVLHGMLMQSSNGAALALAQRVGGTVAGFNRMADARARDLGATHTMMLDPSGLDAKGQEASARDLAVIATALLRNEWLADIVRTKDYPVQWPDGTIAHFGNINRFIDQYSGAVGVKNGYTTVAGNCVVEAAVRGGRTLIVVLIDVVHPYETAARLMTVGFKYAPIGSWQPPRREDPATPAGEVGSSTAPVQQPAASQQTTPKPKKPMPLRAVLFGVVLAYSARVVQVRRRKIRRRQKLRRARVAAARAKVDQMYAVPRPDVSPQDVWLTERTFEPAPRRRASGR